ncbi:hypothetical protein Pan216_35840 [Planctomycetes bacterium Pan216]|uniref:Uncharacterized protein n=1 Tax=Kolteria novifilia TaxID=2527975 RepID=A0A518B6V8_9BACT|nr:hypothetical protein Pan216_35840 [Planctomycetes bacterium Pan216]
MDQDIVEVLEEEIRDAIVEAIKNVGRRQLPLMPGKPTMHLMAKAAVTVYEAALENRQPEK